jgi:glutathione S-transferase
MKISSPALHGEHILIESGIIVQFLADLFPARQLEPASGTPAGAMVRARLNFFVDTWNTKVGSFMFSLFKAHTPEERERFSRDWVAAVRREIEPLLADANPYFGGSRRLTLAEVCARTQTLDFFYGKILMGQKVNVAPFIMRIYALAAAGILPASVSEGLSKLPNFSRWAAAVQREPSVLSVWNADKFTERSQERLDRMKAMKEANHHAK